MKASALTTDSENMWMRGLSASGGGRGNDLKSFVLLSKITFLFLFLF